jgi:hypothetical protein
MVKGVPGQLVSALKIQREMLNVARKRSQKLGKMNFFENSLPKTLVPRSAAEFRYHFLLGSFDDEIFA